MGEPRAVADVDALSTNGRKDGTMKTSTVSHANRTGMAVLALAVLSTGCTTTSAERRAPAESGFLGDNSGLQKNPDFPAALVYVKPDVQWGKYSAIELESAGPHVTDTSTAPSAEDQKLLAGMLYNTMTEELGKYFAEIDYWSKRCAWELWRLGVQLKPGATPPEEPKKPGPFWASIT
jgi:hypothetical protein